MSAEEDWGLDIASGSVTAVSREEERMDVFSFTTRWKLLSEPIPVMCGCSDGTPANRALPARGCRALRPFLE